MAEHCIVIAGVWETSAANHWNFSIDKDYMTRIVPLRPGITLTELLSNVFKEFFETSDALRSASLSYWPPNSKELATGLTTPPVMLTNDGAVSYFYQHFQTNKGINLFVTFNSLRRTPETSRVDENLQPFTTPNQPIKRTHSTLSSSGLRHPSTAGSQIPGFSLFNDDELTLSQESLPVQPQTCTPVQPLNVQPQTCTSGLPRNCLPVQPERCPPIKRPLAASQIPAFSLSTEPRTDRPIPDVGRSCPAKTSRLSLVDETILCGDEMLENMFKEDPDNIPDSWLTDDDEETASDASNSADIDLVQPRGYDEDFWTPLTDKGLGGSDAAEVMAGITVPKTAPVIIHCTTGDAFDHTVLVSGEMPPYFKPELGSSSSYVPPQPGIPVQTRSCPPVHSRNSNPASRSSTHSAGTSTRVETELPHPPTPLRVRPGLSQISAMRNLMSHHCLMILCTKPMMSLI